MSSFVEGSLGADDRSGVVGGDGAGFDGGSGAGTVEAVHVGFGGVAGVGAFDGDFAVFLLCRIRPSSA